MRSFAAKKSALNAQTFTDGSADDTHGHFSIRAIREIRGVSTMRLKLVPSTP
jgi:hypothetical protein